MTIRTINTRIQPCPRCKQLSMHPDKAINALSRRDNETYICPPCGREEEAEDIIAALSVRVLRERT